MSSREKKRSLRERVASMPGMLQVPTNNTSFDSELGSTSTSSEALRAAAGVNRPAEEIVLIAERLAALPSPSAFEGMTSGFPLLTPMGGFPHQAHDAAPFHATPRSLGVEMSTAAAPVSSGLPPTPRRPGVPFKAEPSALGSARRASSLPLEAHMCNARSSQQRQVANLATPPRVMDEQRRTYHDRLGRQEQMEKQHARALHHVKHHENEHMQNDQSQYQAQNRKGLVEHQGHAYGGSQAAQSGQGTHGASDHTVKTSLPQFGHVRPLLSPKPVERQTVKKQRVVPQRKDDDSDALADARSAVQRKFSKNTENIERLERELETITDKREIRIVKNRLAAERSRLSQRERMCVLQFENEKRSRNVQKLELENVALRKELEYLKSFYGAKQTGAR
ncbi:hypothetical protein FVE85_7701 [Porphyridium purpureum]|uniref:BZIP domain-containing protein n=1 Tax=Porphyridium purpureum TaxID=35688 RepID=A0A5J4YK76_PORPP|nr:hypothetical protein FVE85_7701 [Porphyridium purpureum]|eukprot:POR9762..scf210_14